MKKDKAIILIIMLVISFLSVGYSAYGTKLSINELSSSVRLNKDIRITGISVLNVNSDGVSNYEDYNVNDISVGINLPNNDSVVTYKISVTNFESTEMGILEIIGLPENLKYEFIEDNYKLGDKICDSNNVCNLGINKDLYINIGYKDGMYNKDNVEFNINLEFDFRRFYNVVYEDINNNNYPTEVIDGGVFEVDFGSTYPNAVKVYMNDVEINEYSYLNGVLLIKNVSGNLKISSYVEEPVILNSGLYPIKYVDNNWVICSSDDKDWFNYEKQEWANAIILADDVSKEIGDIVDVSSDVRAMFVWIPRYQYLISNDNSNEIYIEFISKEQVDATDGYIIHPAFDFGGNSLSGIWFGKFETSTNTTSKCYTSVSRTNCNNSNQEPYILPNVLPLREQSIYYQYLTGKNMINYLNDSTDADSHMVKNIEWGAVAYLSQSRYGKYGNDNYTGVNKEIYANTSDDLITGMSGGIPAYSSDSDLLFNYDDDFSYDSEGNLIQANGVGASTTGNITGVYDMNGGSHEYVMGYLTTASSSFGSTNSYDYAEFEVTPDSKYYDEFVSNNVNTGCNGSICYGHALSETSNWYSDDNTFVTVDSPWLMRGGVFDSGNTGGIFSYTGTIGYSGSYSSFRISLVFE